MPSSRCGLPALALAWTALAQGPILVRYPYLQNVTSERATLLWATREPGVGTVQGGRD